jgi:hypothetical protein
MGSGDDGLTQRTIAVTVGEFALNSLAGGSGESPGLSLSLVQAIRYYLADRGSGRAGWRYPDFLREDDQVPVREVPLTVETAIWEEFTEEAERQAVSADQLLRHAALYFMADRDAGRLAQRILEDLSREEEA